MLRLSPTEIRADERRKVLREIESHFGVLHGPMGLKDAYTILVRTWQALLAEAGGDDAVDCKHALRVGWRCTKKCPEYEPAAGGDDA